FVPYIFREKPELAEAFSGFTYYPDTMSYAMFTNFGMPAIFGGYDYTPARTNARPELSLMEKHNEALKLMPTLFSEAGYEVDFLNPFYAGYKEVPDLSVFDDMPGVRVYNEDTRYMSSYQATYGIYEQVQLHNMVSFGFLRVLPLACRDWIYDSGYYHRVERKTNGTLRKRFLLHYSWLDHLADATEITQDGRDHLMLCDNQVTHDTEHLQLPEYTPAPFVDNEEYIEQWEIVQDGSLIRGDPDTDKAYECNMAAYLLLAKWFEYLKENGVYDNTRIILVADHGDSDPRLTDTKLDNGVDALAFNPLLMVKDFGADGPMETDDSYMTNADVPTLAMEGLIDDPVNPFTGNPVEMRKDGPQTVTTAPMFSIETNNGNLFDTSGTAWYAVTPGDIFDADNWEYLGPDLPGRKGDTQ
ncbi:MAG: sulfatase-like hydrolase/transferase, partial [Lachnospiraceae bacterium]|nr:sulfatase-like hydrolase/transferase [Lachnospiraceae bacterium]